MLRAAVASIAFHPSQKGAVVFGERAHGCKPRQLDLLICGKSAHRCEHGIAGAVLSQLPSQALVEVAVQDI
eukprot:55903-Eustigmatos_ZCMA.PRE.1